MSKKKVLFVVSDFFHNGAQREMYEFDCALNKDKFDVSIMSITGLNTRQDLPDYFYEKHLSLNSKVHFLNSSLEGNTMSLFYKIVNKLALKFLGKTIQKKPAKTLTTFFNKYDDIVFMGEYTYQHLAKFIPDNYFKKIIIFVMSFRFQSENYRNFNKFNTYHFFGVFSNSKEVQYEFDGFENYNYQYLPLCLKVSTKHKLWEFRNNNETKKIGIFTRLHKDKPLDPFFYAFHLMISQGLNIELHIFGVGNFKLAEYNRYIDNLNLNEKVYFRGHQTDMKQTIINEKIDLVWFQGFNNLPAGYAALEVCLTGTPQLFWDFFVGVNDLTNKMNQEIIYPHFKDLLSFVKASKEVLYDNDSATALSEKQFQDVFINRDILKQIEVVENFLLRKDE